jgi:hypothetical protein
MLKWQNKAVVQVSSVEQLVCNHNLSRMLSWSRMVKLSAKSDGQALRFNASRMVKLSPLAQREAMKSVMATHGVDRAVYHGLQFNYDKGPKVLSPAGKMIRIGTSHAFFNGAVNFFAQAFETTHSYCAIQWAGEDATIAYDDPTPVIC